MIVVEKVMTCFALFYPTALATAYGQRPKFFRAEHSATAEGENCAYGPTLIIFSRPTRILTMKDLLQTWIMDA